MSSLRSLYFAGDTGFGSHFARIREQFGSSQLALLPIGAYEPRWFMSPVHMAPEEALRAHEILGAKTGIVIHHGTFQLADDGIDTAEKQLVACGRDDSFRFSRGVNLPTLHDHSPCTSAVIRRLTAIVKYRSVSGQWFGSRMTARNGRGYVG